MKVAVEVEESLCCLCAVEDAHSESVVGHDVVEDFVHFQVTAWGVVVPRAFWDGLATRKNSLVALRRRTIGVTDKT